VGPEPGLSHPHAEGQGNIRLLSRHRTVGRGTDICRSTGWFNSRASSISSCTGRFNLLVARFRRSFILSGHAESLEYCGWGASVPCRFWKCCCRCHHRKNHQAVSSDQIINAFRLTLLTLSSIQDRALQAAYDYSLDCWISVLHVADYTLVREHELVGISLHIPRVSKHLDLYFCYQLALR
jgi:hypothetical protein